MFTNKTAEYLINEAPILVAAINGEVKLSVRENFHDFVSVPMTLDDIDDLSDALLLARAYLVNLTSQDTIPNNVKP